MIFSLSKTPTKKITKCVKLGLLIPLIGFTNKPLNFTVLCYFEVKNICIQKSAVMEI